MPWVDVGGTDVHYLEGGAGTPRVFLHTHSAHFEKFDAYLRCVQAFRGELGL